MPKLDYATYKERCLTCLNKLSIDAGECIVIDSNAATGNNEATMNNCNIIRTLAKCLDKSQLDEDLDLPRQLCIVCYVKLQSFEEFRSRACYAYEKMYTLVKWQLQEIEYDDEILKDETQLSEQLGETNELESDKLQNSLFETESVLLEPSTITNSDQHIWDPFAKLPARSTEERMCVRPTNKNNRDSTTKLIFNNDEIGNKENIVLAEDNGEGILSKDSTVEFANDCSKSMTCSKKGPQALFTCGQCNSGFSKKLTLDAHIRKVHEGFKRPFKCDRCDKSYSFIGGLNTHIKEIHEATVRSYACDYDGCDHIYTSFVAMKKHLRDKHSTDTTAAPPKKFVCEHCGATFNQSGNLNVHRVSKHPTNEEEKTKKLFNCDICQKAFKTTYTLRYHKLRLHQAAADSSWFECSVCGRKLPKKFMLVQHMRIHSKKQMPCEHCGKEFLRKYELSAHISAVHMKLKPFCCTRCSACFATRKTLRHHEYIHTGKKPYICDICNKGFRQKFCLNKHRKVHSKSKHLLNKNDNNNAAPKMTLKDSTVLAHKAA